MPVSRLFSTARALHRRAGAALALALTVLSHPAQTAGAEAPLQVEKQVYLNVILHDTVPGAIKRMRGACANGTAPTQAGESARAFQMQIKASPGESCVAVLTRTARDGTLPVLYQELMHQAAGTEADAEKLPNAIGTAALANDPRLPIGNGRDLEIHPALAFDAGFTTGYQEAARLKPAAIPDDQLTRITEGCIAQRGTLKNCYMVGAAHGSRSARGSR